MKNNKLNLFVSAILITLFFVILSVPFFIKGEKVENLLKRINTYHYGESNNNKPENNSPSKPSNSGSSGNPSNTSSPENNDKPLNPGDPSGENGNNPSNPGNSEPSNPETPSSGNNNDNPTENTKVYTAYFEKNGADLISESVKSCQGISTCQISLPTITSIKDVIGWGEDENATSANYRPGEIITLNKDKTFYAITKKTVEAIIYGNGAFEGKKVLMCTFYNKANMCNVTLPSLEKDFYSLFGFNRDINSADIEYQENQTVTINTNINLYSVRKINTSIYDQNSAVVNDVFNRINSLRKSKGLRTLAYSKTLELSAMLRISEIVKNYDFNVNGDYHYRISNKKPFYTVNTLAYGENYWKDVNNNAENFHNTFINSPSHLSNILKSDFTSVGISIGKINGYYYIVELFGINE